MQSEQKRSTPVRNRFAPAEAIPTPARVRKSSAAPNPTRKSTARRIRSAALIAAASSAAMVISAQGATFCWTGASTNAWATGANWVGGTQPPSNLTDIAAFDLTSYANQPSATAGRQIGGLINGD